MKMVDQLHTATLHAMPDFASGIKMAKVNDLESAQLEQV